MFCVKPLRNWPLRQQLPVALLGFSGGGALAVLVAGCADSVTHIVTINGNLDTKLWAEMRGFLPLAESMNPIEFGLPERVTQRIYYVGGQDADCTARDLRRV